MQRPRRRIIPNLPDICLRKIFSFLNYRQLCGVEAVCRRWMNMIHAILRRQVNELSVERLASYQCSAVQQIPFKRLNVNSPSTAFDFLSGVLRRSRLNIQRLTCDVQFLANMSQLRVNREPKRRYWSNVEDLWLLLVGCSDQEVAAFEQVFPELFTEQLSSFTLQVHVLKGQTSNVNRVLGAFLRHFPSLHLNVEIHADTAELIHEQLACLSNASLHKLKLICTDFDMPRLSLTNVAQQLHDQKLVIKNLTVRDWSVHCDQTRMLAYNAIDTFRLSSCTVESPEGLVRAFQTTCEQPTEKKRVVVKKKAPRDPDDPSRTTTDTTVVKKRKKLDGSAVTDASPPKPVKKVVKKVVPKRRVRRVELAGQVVLQGLQFLDNRAHEEFEKNMSLYAPSVDVDCSEIYYCY